jgi:NAD(P)-dependent dehydrogenase (short-subunit alcohol dehydrogenase family)
MHWLSGKSIVVIGGTSGIGHSAVQAFLREGARVVAVGLANEAVLSDQYSNNCQVMLGDATKEGVAESSIERCLESFQSFDGLYHVAGGSGRKFGDGPLHELTLAAWNKTLELNLTSLMLSCRAAIRVFKKRKSGGSILNMASVLGFSPSPEYFATHAYAAAKAAVIGFTKSIAAHYAAENVRVNALAPGLVNTPMAQRAASDEEILSFIKTKQPLDGGRIGVSADLDGAAVYFMSDYSKFATGQVLSISGGWEISDGQF